MTDQSKLLVFSGSYVDHLTEAIATNVGVVPNCDDATLGKGLIATNLYVSGQLPDLNPSMTEESGNAIKVHTFLQNLTRTQALEERLWLYLAFIPFRPYMLQRWATDTEDDNKIASRWLMGSQKPLSRQGIARLWWGAEMSSLTPEEQKEFLGEDTTVEKYTYTQILFKNPSIFTDIMERGGFCNSKKIVIALLEFLSNNPLIMNDRLANRNLFKNITQELAFRKLDSLSYTMVYETIESLASIESEALTSV